MEESYIKPGIKPNNFLNSIIMFAGHYGSGKSEISLNFALEMKKHADNISFGDLDIVNPFFRSADGKNLMESEGIRFIKTLYAGTNVDIPALPAELNALFDDKNSILILDIGGDDLGAKVVSRYRDEILNFGKHNFLCVVNIMRPLTSTPSQIMQMISEIEGSSRFKITGLVNNTNLLGETKPENILEGHKILKQVSEKTGIEITFAAGLSRAFKGIEDIMMNETSNGILLLDRIIRLPWD